jgi:hypothetical protein
VAAPNLSLSGTRVVYGIAVAVTERQRVLPGLEGHAHIESAVRQRVGVEFGVVHCARTGGWAELDYAG